MRHDLSPTICLWFETENARSLCWLPLAVRHKLDEAGLRLKLEQWQTLPISTRADLLHRFPHEGFASEAKRAGARTGDVQGMDQKVIDAADAALILGIALRDAQAWLNQASPFARYVMYKRIGLGKRE